MRPTACRSVIAMAAGGFLLLVLSGCSVPGFGPDAGDAVRGLTS